MAAATALVVGVQGSTATTESAGSLGHVFLVVMENHSYETIIGNPDAPYVNGLADKFGMADQFRAIAHPSLPNYLALASGHTYGYREDCNACFVDDTNIADELEASGRTWKSYQEGLPHPCFLGVGAGYYVEHHNPFVYYQAIRNNPARCQNVVPFDQFGADMAAGSVPDLAWISPNLMHDMHDGSIADGDQWIAGLVPDILASPAWQQNGLLIIVWDEAGGGSPTDPDGGHVAALFISPDMAPGTRSSTPASPYSLLRTLEQGWGLGLVGHSGDPDVEALTDLVPSAALSGPPAESQ